MLKTTLPIPPRLTSEPNPHIVSALRYAKRNLWDGTGPSSHTCTPTPC